MECQPLPLKRPRFGAASYGTWVHSTPAGGWQSQPGGHGAGAHPQQGGASGGQGAAGPDGRGKRQSRKKITQNQQDGG